MTKTNLLKLLFTEAETYSSFDKIEELLQTGMDLSNHPIQPLYVAVKSMEADVAATYLPRFSKMQRKVMQDIDLWKNDSVDPTDFGFWVESFAHCDDEDIRLDFVQGNEFLLWLKSRVNIWTFDVEDPLYPDHDNYFLTEDNLLLIEFDESFEFVHEVKNFIRELYAAWGVERAYAHLFKMVSSSFIIVQEEEYQIKKSLEQDFGFVDYYSALELTATYRHKELLDGFIKRYKEATGNIDEVAQGQNLHTNAILPYKSEMDSIFDELDLVTDEKRFKFLNFDFIRLVNAGLTLDSALKAGPVAMSKVGRRTKQAMLLGLDYVKVLRPESPKEGYFSMFLFSDFYKIGQSLLKINQSKINKILNLFQYNDVKEAFLGRYWNEFLSASFEDLAKYFYSFSERPIDINSYRSFSSWEKDSETLISLVPFINGLWETLERMKSTGNIMDDFYLNYKVDDLDFESIMISNFANYLLGHFYDEKHTPRLGVSVLEFKKFISLSLDNGELKNLEHEINGFKNRFGLNQIEYFDSYLIKILKEHLEGYDFDQMELDDFIHVGGPVILTNIKH